jgi:beta-lactamase regulating signal transducer with metallopeptidase domain
MDLSLVASLSRQAADVAVAGLWQGLAIALGLALCLKCLPRISAAHRFAIWFAGFVVAATLPLAPVLRAFLPSASASLGTAAPVQGSWLRIDERWALVVAAIWVAASLARGADLAFHIGRLRRLWVSATPIDVPGLSKSQREFQICSTQWIDRPSVIGFFAPRVLIPDWLLPRLTAGELEQIVMHESAHLARRDDWSNLLEKICLILFPLNLALWVIDGRLAKEREMACDEAVIRKTQAPRAYAACLASVAERGLAHRAEALSLGAWQRRPELAQRVHKILHRKKTLRPAAARVVLGTLGCGLIAASFALAHCPEMVTFRAPESASVAGSATELGDAVYPNNPRNAALMPGVFAEQAKAVLPARPMSRPVASRAQRRKAAAGGELRAASSEPGALLPLGLRAKARRANGGQEDAQQFIVLTTWEQVEAPARSTQPVADYDTRAAASDHAAGNAPLTSSPQTARTNPTQSEANAFAGVPETGRITVTRLVFRVVSPNSDAKAADAKTKSSQPALIPFGDGWLVIQL